MSNFAGSHSKEVPGCSNQTSSQEIIEPPLSISVQIINDERVAVSTKSPTEMFLQGYGTIEHRYIGDQYVPVLVFAGQKKEIDTYGLSIRRQIVNNATRYRPWNTIYYRGISENSRVEIPLVYINPDQRLKNALNKNPYAIAAGVVFLIAVASCASQVPGAIARFTSQAPISDDGPEKIKTPRTTPANKPTYTTTPERTTTPEAVSTDEPAHTTTSEGTTTPALTQPAVLPSEAVSNKNTLVVCPLQDGRAITLPVINENTPLPENALTSSVPDEDKQLLVRYHEALARLGLAKNQVAVCLSDGTGLSDVVAVYEIGEVNSNGQGKTILLKDYYLLYVYDGQTESFVELTDDQTFSPETKWLQTGLIDGSFFASQFSTGKRGESNFFDGVVAYKIDEELGETIYAVIAQDNQGKPAVYTGKTMLDLFGKALTKVDHPLFTYENIPDGILSDPNSSFGYELTTGENGRTALRIVIRAKNGEIVWPVNKQQAEAINQSIKTNNIFIELMASYDEKTQQGTIEIKNKDGKVVETVAVTLSTASVETPDFAYAYSKDGTRIFVFNEKRDGLVAIPVEQKVKIEKIKNENVTNRDTKEKEWQLSDGIFYYDKESGRWLSGAGIHIPNGKNWEKNKHSILTAWLDDLDVSDYSPEDQKIIKDALRENMDKISSDDSIPGFVKSKNPNIRVDPLMLGDPARLLVLVKKIKRANSATIEAAGAMWHERKNGIMYLNLPSILEGSWDKKYSPLFITQDIAKEAAVIGMFLMAAGSPFDVVEEKKVTGEEVGSLTVFTPLEVEWSSNIINILVLQSYIKQYPHWASDFQYLIDYYKDMFLNPQKFINHL